MRSKIRLVALVAFAGPFVVYPTIAEIRIDAAKELEYRNIQATLDNWHARLIAQDTNAEVRALSALAIAQSGDESAFDILSASVSSPNSAVQLASLQGLVELRDARSLPIYEEILIGNNSLAHKQLSLSALARENTTESNRMIARAGQQRGQHQRVKVSVAQYFRYMPGEMSDETLLFLVQDPDSEVRARAAIGLSDRFEGNFDSVLAIVAIDPALPNHVWVDVVTQLERRRGRTFGELKASDLRYSGSRAGEDKAEIVEAISDWAKEQGYK